MPTSSQFKRQLRWSNRSPNRLNPSPTLKHWLMDAGSLTAKLIELSRGNFHVQVLRQVIGRARRDEALAMVIPRHQLCLVREVVLMGNGQPWVFARSLLPLTSLVGPLRRLRHQGARPLGAFLFSQPQLARSPIALSLISRHHGYVPDALIGTSQVWGRRSIFYLDNKPLLVSEVFLPGFPVALESNRKMTKL